MKFLSGIHVPKILAARDLINRPDMSILDFKVGGFYQIGKM